MTYIFQHILVVKKICLGSSKWFRCKGIVSIVKQMCMAKEIGSVVHQMCFWFRKCVCGQGNVSVVQEMCLLARKCVCGKETCL